LQQLELVINIYYENLRSDTFEGFYKEVAQITQYLEKLHQIGLLISSSRIPLLVEPLTALPQR
jgi:hypothetical protein